MRPGLKAASESRTVVTAARVSRTWEWPIPDEMLLFADNGVGDYFGLWLPGGKRRRTLVVEVGEVCEPACLAPVGDDPAELPARQDCLLPEHPGGDGRP